MQIKYMEHSGGLFIPVIVVWLLMSNLVLITNIITHKV